MGLTYSKHSLKKVETILDELGYNLRYERGSFKAGYCIVENKNIVVVNKFFDTESRMNCLMEILEQVEKDEKILSEASQKMLNLILREKAEATAVH